jgi:hypothetical protein
MQTTVRRLTKTSMAWEALSRPDQVSREAHTLLLMANGRRSQLELSALLGTNIDELAHTLQAQGYLREAEWSAPGEPEEDTTNSA